MVECAISDVPGKASEGKTVQEMDICRAVIPILRIEKSGVLDDMPRANMEGGSTGL